MHPIYNPPEALLAEEPKSTSSRRWRISLRVSVVLVMVGAVAMTSAAVHLPWFFISRENVADMSRQLNAEIVSGVNRELATLFESAESAQESLRGAIEAEVFQIEDKAKRDALFFAVLQAYPHFSWVSFGAPNGDFFGAQRRDEVNLRIAESRWSAERGEAERVETYFVDDGVRVSRTVTKREVNDYDSRSREWFKAAIATPGRHVWTDIYVFSASRRPGLNTAVTAERAATGERIGVVSIAIELERISRYLAGLPSLRSGGAFLADRQGRLVAFGEPSEVTRLSADGSEPELRPLKESNHPLLALAAQGIAAGGLSLATVAEPVQIVAEDLAGERHFLSLAPAAREGWIVGTVIPEADFMGAIKANQARLALIVGALLALVGLAALFISRSLLVRPLDALVAETEKVARFDLDSVRPVDSTVVEVAALSDAVGRMARGLGSFRRYIPMDLVRALHDRDVVAELGGQRRTMTVMFMDLEGFTTISERLGHRVAPLLADYFGAMSRAIEGRKGTIDKFMGDGVMAFWGAPAYDEDHPLHACLAALDCQAEMDRLRKEWTAKGLPAPRLRIGVTTGRVVVGNFGSEERLNYTVIGDPVNLAARLEGMNRTYGTRILISGECWELVKYDMCARRVDVAKVKGKDEPTTLYELLAARDESGRVEPGFEWAERYEAGFALLSERRFGEAAEAFREAVAAKGAEDGPSRRHLERIEAEMAAAPPRPRAVDPAAAPKRDA